MDFVHFGFKSIQQSSARNLRSGRGAFPKCHRHTREGEWRRPQENGGRRVSCRQSRGLRRPQADRLIIFNYSSSHQNLITHNFHRSHTKSLRRHAARKKIVPLMIAQSIATGRFSSGRPTDNGRIMAVFHLVSVPTGQEGVVSAIVL